MRNLFVRVLLVCLLSGSMLSQSLKTGDRPVMGFSAESARAQRALEAKFDSSLKADNLRVWMKRMSARPHHVGSPHGKETAEFMAAQFRSWGFETEIVRYDVLFPTPRVRIVEMTAPVKFRAKLNEPALRQDPSTGQQAEQLPTYNAYSVDGDVTAPLVYVNYGVPADYDALERRGIDVRGKIVIARYGGSWRGIKPKVAAEHGAVGCIIFSDPRNDGFYQGDVYPKGAWRNEDGVQRGSVADMPLFPGDPLTPGTPSTKDAKRLDIKGAPTLTKIPVLPISYADALPMLRQLDGAVVPDSWRGGLPITYHFGGKTPTVRLKLQFNWDIKPIYNVSAKMRGGESPDQWVIRGNHHDAWVNGAEDPISGLVALMEEARGVGELAKTGWKPKRTIVYNAWDGEEPGLLGSTEWVEDHAETLAKNAVAYINTDSNGRGFLGVGGSHTLEKFINEVGRDIPDPQTAMSVWDRARAQQMVSGSPAEKKEARDRPDLRIGALGSGSDFTPFLQHAGIASLNIGFGGEDGGGSYHSIYDSFAHYTRFGDPDHAYGIALAKVCGHATLRLANADTLPFEFTNFAETVSGYADEVAKLADSMREDTKTMNNLITSGMLKAVQDPKEIYVIPKTKGDVPDLNFGPLKGAVKKLEDAAKDYQKAAGDKKLNPAALKALNEVLYRSERALMRDQGLPRREWFKHQIYAPGFYTGYGVKTLPAIREAIEQRDWKEAAEQIDIVARVIEGFANEVERATKLAKGN